MTTAATHLYPAWKEAVGQFLAKNFMVREVIPLSWFYEQFRILQPAPTTSFENAKRAQFQFRSAFENFQNALLEDHQIALKNHFGEGYSIVPPNQQARWALHRVMRDTKKILKKGALRMTNVNTAQLSLTERTEQSDCLTRLAAITGFVKEQAKLPKF